MLNPGDQVIFTRDYQNCKVGDAGVIKRAESSVIFGRFYLKLELSTERGPVSITYTQHSRTLKIKPKTSKGGKA